MVPMGCGEFNYTEQTLRCRAENYCSQTEINPDGSKNPTNVARGSLHFHNRAPAFLCLILANQNWFHRVVSVNGCHRILIYRPHLH